MDGIRIKRISDVSTELAVRGPLTVTEVSTSLSLPVSSTHDLLKAMVSAGMAEVTSGGYVVGPSLVQLSFKVQERFEVVTLATPELEKLVERVGLDVYLAVRTGTQVMYAKRFPGRRGVNIDIPLGLPLYRHATAVGKLFAAFDRELRQALLANPRVKLTPRTRTETQEIERDLKTIRSRGISVSKEEAVEGIIGIATPIRNPVGTIVGAAHISALKSSLVGARFNDVCQELQKTTEAIESRFLGENPIHVNTESPALDYAYSGPPIAKPRKPSPSIA